MRSSRTDVLLLLGIMPVLILTMPCCCDSANSVCSVISLSPLIPALLVKPAASLSFQTCCAQTAEDASANFLKCQLTLAM